MKKEAIKNRDKYEEELVQEVLRDFVARRKERIMLERQWELNTAFYEGKQYTGLTSSGEIIEGEKDYAWQARGVYNHIASIIEARLSKLTLVKPVVSVRPASNDASEIYNASLAEMLLASSFKKLKFEEIVSLVLKWSEICGTAFYKIVWDKNGGNKVGSTTEGDVFEGDVKILAVSPFEIFPDSLNANKIEDCMSIIHAKKMSKEDILAQFGVCVDGESGVLTDKDNLKTSNTDNLITVIERYEKPSVDYPLGRLITVAGDKLLFAGDLPYVNADFNKRGYPFVKHVCCEHAGSFFGKSIIERLIPVQRAYNAVKNRKHEFMNRITMGVMTVEDGSVDVDDLTDDGLSPGKIVIYRQGSKAPEMMRETTLPQIFNEEEEKLLNEFVIVSGVSDIMSSATEHGVSSGTALEILISQYNERLLVNADIIRNTYVEVSKQILKLYKQFMIKVRAIKNVDNDAKTKIFYVDKNVMTADDVYVDSENELIYTPKQKKEMLLNLYNSGLLFNSEGKLPQTTKEKLLSLLGYKILDSTGGLIKLHQEKAQSENEQIRLGKVKVEIVDDHEIHVEEHTKYYLSEIEKLNDVERENVLRHVAEHKSNMTVSK